MTRSRPRRNTTLRDKHRAVIRRSSPPCALCGGAIDYTLKHPHPASFVVDHIRPMARGGADTLDNKQAAHRLCNAKKYDKLVGQTRSRQGAPMPRHPIRRSHALVRSAQLWHLDFEQGHITADERDARLDIVDQLDTEEIDRDQYGVLMRQLDEELMK